MPIVEPYGLGSVRRSGRKKPQPPGGFIRQPYRPPPIFSDPEGLLPVQGRPRVGSAPPPRVNVPPVETVAEVPPIETVAEVPPETVAEVPPETVAEVPPVGEKERVKWDPSDIERLWDTHRRKIELERVLGLSDLDETRVLGQHDEDYTSLLERLRRTFRQGWVNVASQASSGLGRSLGTGAFNYLKDQQRQNVSETSKQAREQHVRARGDDAREFNAQQSTYENEITALNSLIHRLWGEGALEAENIPELFKLVVGPDAPQ